MNISTTSSSCPSILIFGRTVWSSTYLTFDFSALILNPILAASRTRLDVGSYRWYLSFASRAMSSAKSKSGSRVLPFTIMPECDPTRAFFITKSNAMGYRKDDRMRLTLVSWQRSWWTPCPFDAVVEMVVQRLEGRDEFSRNTLRTRMCQNPGAFSASRAILSAKSKWSHKCTLSRPFLKSIKLEISRLYSAYCSMILHNAKIWLAHDRLRLKFARSSWKCRLAVA